MAESFGSGLASGLNGLLSTLRSDRERKAQENFKLKLIEDDKRTSSEIADRVRKQRALEVFGRGLNDIKDQKINGALSQLTGNAVKHAKSTSKPLDEYQRQYSKLNDKIESMTEKLASYLDKADLKDANDIGGLMASENSIKDPAKKAEFTNTKNLLNDYINRKDELGKILEGGLSEQQNLQGDVEARAEALRKFNIDDALNTREAKVLQLSLGLTDDDVAQFRQGGKPTGTSFEDILGVPFQSTIQNPKPSEFTFKENLGVSDNPAKRAILKERMTNAVKNLPNDITSLKEFNSQDFADARNDPEIKPILEQGLLTIKNIGGAVKQRIVQGTASDPEFKTLNNITKLGAELNPEQFQKIRTSQGDDGATTTVQFLSDLGTPDTFSGLSAINQRLNDTMSQKDLSGKADNFDSYLRGAQQELQSTPSNIFGGTSNRQKRLGIDMKAYQRGKDSTNQEIQQNETKLKSFSDLVQNFNDFKNTIVDPNKPYKYRPVDFGK